VAAPGGQDGHRGGDKNGRVGIWDVDEADGGACLWAFSGGHARPVTALAWAGDALFTGGYDSLVRKYDFNRLESAVVADYGSLVNDEAVGHLAHWCLDGDALYGAHNCGALTLRDLRSPSKPTVVDAHGKKAAHVAKRPGRDQVATSSNDGTLRVWDLRALAKKRPEAAWSVAHGRSIHGFDFSADGASVVTVSYDDTLGFFDVGGDAGGVRVRHNNHTGRYLTPFKPIFDPHAASPTAIVGSMGRPRAVDVVSASGKVAALNDGDGVFHAVTSLHAVHPFVHAIAGANNSGRVSIWR